MTVRDSLHFGVWKPWSETTIYTPPYVEKIKCGTITQFPNNTGLADYIDENEFFAVYLKLLENAMELLQAHAKSQGHQIIPVVFRDYPKSAIVKR